MYWPIFLLTLNILNMKSKVCKKCGIEKPFSEFSNEKRVKDGKAARCNQCEHERQSSPEYKERKRVTDKNRRNKILNPNGYIKYKKQQEAYLKRTHYRKKEVYMLKDNYIKGLIASSLSYATSKDIPQNMIDLKRQHLLLKRNLGLTRTGCQLPYTLESTNIDELKHLRRYCSVRKSKLRMKLAKKCSVDNKAEILQEINYLDERIINSIKLRIKELSLK